MPVQPASQVHQQYSKSTLQAQQDSNAAHHPALHKTPTAIMSATRTPSPTPSLTRSASSTRSTIDTDTAERSHTHTHLATPSTSSSAASTHSSTHSHGTAATSFTSLCTRCQAASSPSRTPPEIVARDPGPCPELCPPRWRRVKRGRRERVVGALKAVGKVVGRGKKDGKEGKGERERERVWIEPFGTAVDAVGGEEGGDEDGEEGDVEMEEEGIGEEIGEEIEGEGEGRDGRESMAERKFAMPGQWPLELNL